MNFTLVFTTEALTAARALKNDPALAIACTAVNDALRQLERDPQFPGLRIHARKGEQCPHGKTLFQVYAQNNTPAAYRIFFCYGDARATINVIAITQHT